MRTRSVLASLGLVVGLSSGLVSAPAHAEYRGTYPSVYSKNGCSNSDIKLNGKNEPSVQGCKEVTKYIDFLNTTSCTDTVTAAVYSLTVPEVYLAWKRLIECGANVYIVWAKPIKDDKESEPSEWMTALTKLKGKHFTIKRVTGSGMADHNTGVQHLKQLERKSDYRSLMPSWNTAFSTDRDAWNGAFDVRDVKLYNANVSMIRASAKDKKQSACKYSSAGTDARRHVYFTPCDTRPVYDILKTLHAGPGCEYWWQMFYVTTDVKQSAHNELGQVKRLAGEGCKIHVLVNYGGTWTVSIIRELSGTKNIDVHDASYDPKHPDVKVYNHAKRKGGKGFRRYGKPYAFMSDGSLVDAKASYVNSTNFVLISTVPEEVAAGVNWMTLAHNSSRTLTYAQLCKPVKKKLPSGC